MNKQSHIGTVHSPQVPVAPASGYSPVTEVGAFPIGATSLEAETRPEGRVSPNPFNLITADASKVSGRDFLDAITGRSPEIRAAEREQMIRQCIRAIERGDTYGFPPMLVDECREIMAGESGWALAERSAYGMGAK